MKFKISEHEIYKKKRWPFLVILIMAFMAMFFAFPIDNEQFNWLLFFKTFGLGSVMGVAFTGRDAFTFIKFANGHSIEISPEGLKSHQRGAFTLIPWDIVTSVKLKTKKNKIHTLLLTTKEFGSVDLSIYEKLDVLKHELMVHLDDSLWK